MNGDFHRALADDDFTTLFRRNLARTEEFFVASFCPLFVNHEWWNSEGNRAKISERSEATSRKPPAA